MKKFYFNNDEELTDENFDKTCINNSIQLSTEHLNNLDKKKWYYFEYEKEMTGVSKQNPEILAVKFINIDIDGTFLKWLCEKENRLINIVFEYDEEEDSVIFLPYNNIIYTKGNNDCEWTIMCSKS